MERSDVRKARMEREGHLSHWDPAVAELIDSVKAERDGWKYQYGLLADQLEDVIAWKKRAETAERERDQWKENFNDMVGFLKVVLCKPDADNPLPDGGKWVEPMGDFQ